MNDPQKLICGMTKSTAQHYKVIRQEIDLILCRVHQAGYWLTLYDIAVNPKGPNTPLTQTGRTIMHHMWLIYSYLDDEFASLDTVRDALKTTEP